MLTEALLTIANMWEKNGLLIYLQYGGTLKPLCLVKRPDGGSDNAPRSQELESFYPPSHPQGLKEKANRYVTVNIHPCFRCLLSAKNKTLGDTGY